MALYTSTWWFNRNADFVASTLSLCLYPTTKWMYSKPWWTPTPTPKRAAFWHPGIYSAPTGSAYQGQGHFVGGSMFHIHSASIKLTMTAPTAIDTPTQTWPVAKSYSRSKHSRQFHYKCVGISSSTPPQVNTGHSHATVIVTFV